jgi:hypothetical protein
MSVTASDNKEYFDRIREYERKSNVPWAELDSPTIVLEYRWLYAGEGALSDKTKFYRVPRCSFLADCYWYYLADESKRRAPAYSAAVTWWQFLSKIGDGSGDWTDTCGSIIEKPLDGEYVLKAHLCNGLSIADIDTFYVLCKLHGQRWSRYIGCGECGKPVSSRTRSKAKAE